jgi:hypothetical protein
MKTLITSAQVAAEAFRAPDFIQPYAVAEATILAAQRRHIRPVLGEKLYAALCGGGHATFLEEYVRPPLALYVKLSMLPSLAVQVGGAGVVELHSTNLARAGEARTRAAARRLRSEAGALMRRAVEHVEASPALFPEYDPAENILNRCSMAGGVVLTKTACHGERR